MKLSTLYDFRWHPYEIYPDIKSHLNHFLVHNTAYNGPQRMREACDCVIIVLIYTLQFILWRATP